MVVSFGEERTSNEVAVICVERFALALHLVQPLLNYILTTVYAKRHPRNLEISYLIAKALGVLD